MSVPYDIFTQAFLDKITEFEFCRIESGKREDIIDGYMKRALSEFQPVCKIDFLGSANDAERTFDLDSALQVGTDIINIVSEGMVAQWLKTYVYKQELLENVLNTRDFTSYSPAELLMRVGNAYRQVQKDYTQMMREYSYNNGNLADLHL